MTSTARPIEKAGICYPLGTDMAWSNTSQWLMCHVLNTGITNQVLICQTVSSACLTRWTSDDKRSGLLRLARFIDRPHQEKPGSPKQCLRSCQMATHTQTLAYIKLCYWRSADKNKLKQKSWSLCNSPCSDTRVIRAAWLVCACEHTVCGGCGMRCLIRVLRRRIRHASYNNQHSFDQIKMSLPLKFLLSLHSCHPARLAHKHSCQSLNPDLMNREGK